MATLIDRISYYLAGGLPMDADLIVALVIPMDGLFIFIHVQVTVALLAPTCFFTSKHKVDPEAAAGADVHTTLELALDL